MVTLSYLRDPNFQRRTFTVFAIGPTILYFLSTFTGFVAICWALHFVAMLEWTGLKRHLKLCLLDPLIFPQRRRLQQQQQQARRSPRNSQAAVLNPLEAAGLSAKHQQQQQHDAAEAAENKHSTTGTGWGGTNEDEEDVVVIEDLEPFPQGEFPCPIAPRNLFITGKCFLCSLICPLAALKMDYFPLILTAYFFFWVMLTLLDKNRVETKQDVARKKIKLTSRTRSSSLNSARRGNYNSSTGTNSSKKQQQQQQQQVQTAEPPKPPLPDADEFALRELEIISVFPNVEVFLNFCLEYFGFVWISNLAFACLLLNLGTQGHACVIVALVANWMNDIGALMVGKTLKALKFETRPLYPRISPNKSVEGAVGGVFANALAASLGSWLLPAAAIGVPNPQWTFFVVGLFLGLLGVIGDLLQSLFKRVARVKDTGTVFPGHGGVLDRIDGLVTTLPPVFWLVWGLQRGYFEGVLI